MAPAKKSKNSVVTMVMPRGIWEQFQAYADAEGTNRAVLLRSYVIRTVRSAEKAEYRRARNLERAQRPLV
jgi:hypothetical protein